MLAGDVDRRRAQRGACARARRRRRAGSGAANVRVVVADGRDAPRRAHGLRSRARRRTVLGARRAEPSPGSPVARHAAPEAAARAPAGGRRARSRRRDDRLLGLHDQRRGVGGRRRRLGARGRSDARRGVAPVPAIRGARSSSRRCRTSTARPGSSSHASPCAEDPSSPPRRARRASRRRSSHAHARLCATPQPRARSRSRPSVGEDVEPAGDRVGVPEEPARLELALAHERLRVDHEPRLARRAEHVPAVEVLVHEVGRRPVDRAVDVERGIEQRPFERRCRRP